MSSRKENRERRSMSEVKCIYGQSTKKPCPRPGTVAQPDRLGEGVKICEVHAALTPLTEEVDDLALALEMFKEWDEWARMHDNEPLIRLLERARMEFTERMELLDKHTETVSLAGR
jgi:hypothetical protein